jgi:hypothetical protein
VVGSGGVEVLCADVAKQVEFLAGLGAGAWEQHDEELVS